MYINLKAADIEDWVNKEPRRAQEILPNLIIRLILCSSNKIISYNFPVESGIQYSGYDGVLDTEEGTAYFSAGKSVWEFGTNKDIAAKFREDIEKRHQNPLGENILDTEFIFVTLRIWNRHKSIEELLNESRKKYNWRNIRILDASTIAIWLSSHPGVSVWLANQMGKHITGIYSIDDYWNIHCMNMLPSYPELNKEFFLYKRENQAKELIDWFRKKSGCLTLIAESQLEATLFAISCLYEQRDTESQEAFSYSALIVKTTEQWENLVEGNEEQEKKTLLIPIFRDAQNLDCPPDVFALFPVEQFSPLAKSNTMRITLRKRTKNDFHNVLRRWGGDTRDLDRIERTAGQEFLVFYRTIVNSSLYRHPLWLEQRNCDDLLPALLLGAWDLEYTGDCDAIARLSRLDYESYVKQIDSWILMEDSPFIRVNTVYQVKSISEMWKFLGEHLSDFYIRNLIQCTSLAFSENTAPDVPHTEYPESDVLPNKKGFSNLLRRGLIISLIFISQKPDSECIDAVIKKILASVQSYERWSFISPLLSLMAEASPQTVLEKLEEAISSDEAEFWKLFPSSGAAKLYNDNYFNIFWTLEQLVLNSKYVIQSIEVLCKINEKTHDLADSEPLIVLYRVFCPWYPQCCLDVDERIQLLERVYRRYPITGKALIHELLPHTHSYTLSIKMPEWTMFDDSFTQGVTQEECYRSIRKILSIALQNASTIEQWRDILRNVDFFSQYYKSWENELLKFCDGISDDEKIEISDALREYISLCRAHPHAERVIPERDVQSLERLFFKIIPNRIERFKYYFQNYPRLLHPIPYDRTKSYFDELDVLVHQKRMQAISQILQDYGQDALLNFSFQVEDVRELADVIVSEILHGTYDLPTLFQLKEGSKRTFSAVLYRLYAQNEPGHGAERLIDILQNADCSLEEKASILLNSPANMQIWNKMNSLNKSVCDYYWQYVEMPPGFNDMSEWEYYLNHLLMYKRPFSALKSVASFGYSNSSTVFHVLESCAKLKDHVESDGTTLQTLDEDPSVITSLFRKLYNDPAIDWNSLVEIECVFFPYFRYSETPRAIIEYVRKNPLEYVKLILSAHTLKPESSLLDTAQPPYEIARADQILNMITVIPGYANNSIEESVFTDWMTEARHYADEKNCRQAFDSYVGRLLSYSPPGTDGIFPHEVIRDYFESAYSEILADGFVRGIINRRGLYTPTAGKEEEKIAERYKHYAKKLRMYPQTVRVLSKVEKLYREQSRRDRMEDELDIR